MLPEFSSISDSGNYRAVHLGRPSSTVCVHIHIYTVTHLHISSHRTVLLQTSTRLHPLFSLCPILLSPTVFPRPSIGAPVLTYSSITSHKPCKSSRIIPQDGCCYICKPASDPCVLFYLLTSVLCRLSCPACYHLSGLKDFCSELLCDIVVTS